MLQQTEQAAEQAQWLQCVENEADRQREESMVMRDALVVAESIRAREGRNDTLSHELMRANDQLATYMDEALQNADVDDDDDVTWVQLRALLAAEPMSATTTTTAGRVVRERAQHPGPGGAPSGARAPRRGVDAVVGGAARARQERQGVGGRPARPHAPPPRGGHRGE